MHIKQILNGKALVSQIYDSAYGIYEDHPVLTCGPSVYMLTFASELIFGATCALQVKLCNTRCNKSYFTFIS